MITKAIIESVDDPYYVKVRIPALDSGSDYMDSTSYSDLSEAIICTLPNANYLPAVGDIVLVAFEDNDLGKPIIIGCLFKESGNISEIDLTLNNLTVNSTSQLGTNTYIGNISYEQLKYLDGLRQNIQATFQNIEDRLDKLEGNS